MLVRPYMAEDLEQVKALHQAQGLAYELPDLEAPSMLVRAVIEEDGRITDAAFLRKTSEAYWIFSPQTSKRDRLGRMLVLSKELVDPAKRAGLEDVHAFVPPELVDESKSDGLKMHRTFLRLGWSRSLWACYGRSVI